MLRQCDLLLLANVNTIYWLEAIVLRQCDLLDIYIYIYIIKRIIHWSVIGLSFEGQLLLVHASFPFAIRAAEEAERPTPRCCNGCRQGMQQITRRTTKSKLQVIQLFIQNSKYEMKYIYTPNTKTTWFNTGPPYVLAAEHAHRCGGCTTRWSRGLGNGR